MARGNRRWFLGAAGSVATAAGLSIVGCGGSPDNPLATATVRPSPTALPSATPPPTVRPTPTRDPNDQHGAFIRYTAFIRSAGQFDPHRLGSPSLKGHQALIYSRLLTYQSQRDGIIKPDLALALPEQPDTQTYIFRLNPEAKWLPTVPLNGRRVTAEDVKFSIERQQDADDTSFERRAQWSLVDSVEAPDDGTVILTTSTPYAELQDLAAGVSSFIVSPEVAANGDLGSPIHQIGSGPFQWVEWSEGNFASVSRNDEWFGGGTRPFLEGVTAFQRTDSEEVEGDLRTRALDAAIVGRPQAKILKQSVARLREVTTDLSLFFSMRFSTTDAPYNDERLRTAISIALDRRAMVDEFFSGSGTVNPWISTAINRWALPQSELNDTPGYRPGTGGRQQDIQDAQALLAAYQGDLDDDEQPEPLELLVTVDAEEVLGMGTLMNRQLQANLGIPVKVSPVPIGELIQRLFDRQAPWAAGPDTGWTGLDDWTYQYFHSSGTNNSFLLRDEDLDAQLDAQRAEMDPDIRQQLGYAIQRKLLEMNVAANFVSETVVTLMWPYVKDFPADAADGYQDRFADCWIDQNDPSFARS